MSDGKCIFCEGMVYLRYCSACGGNVCQACHQQRQGCGQGEAEQPGPPPLQGAPDAEGGRLAIRRRTRGRRRQIEVTEPAFCHICHRETEVPEGDKEPLCGRPECHATALAMKHAHAAGFWQTWAQLCVADVLRELEKRSAAQALDGDCVPEGMSSAPFYHASQELGKFRHWVREKWTPENWTIPQAFIPPIQEQADCRAGCGKPARREEWTCGDPTCLMAVQMERG